MLNVAIFITSYTVSKYQVYNIIYAPDSIGQSGVFCGLTTDGHDIMIRFWNARLCFGGFHINGQAVSRPFYVPCDFFSVEGQQVVISVKYG